jgi:molybdenum cofactor cytidylyltransferase
MRLPIFPKVQLESIYVAILAAGTSKRFGSTKQITPLAGIPLVRHVVDVARQVCDNRTLIIAGHDWSNVIKAASTDGSFFAINEHYASGMGSSIAMAIRTCRSREDAVLLMLCDQPLITTQHLRSLIEKWSGDENEIVATAFAETIGPPVLFAKGAFADLIALRGDHGANALLHDPRFKLLSVPFADAAVDIDTLKDLDALQGTAASRQ